MHLYPEGDHFPAGRSYRALMQQAIAERNRGRMDAYFNLLEEAEQILRELRHSFVVEAKTGHTGEARQL